MRPVDAWPPTLPLQLPSLAEGGALWFTDLTVRPQQAQQAPCWAAHPAIACFGCRQACKDAGPPALPCPPGFLHLLLAIVPLDVHLIALHRSVSLQVADPTYMLPALAGLSFLATVELGAADGMEGQVRPAAVLAPGAACVLRPTTTTDACACREHHVYAVQLRSASALSVAQ